MNPIRRSVLLPPDTSLSEKIILYNVYLGALGLVYIFLKLKTTFESLLIVLADYRDKTSDGQIVVVVNQTMDTWNAQTTTLLKVVASQCTAFV